MKNLLLGLFLICIVSCAKPYYYSYTTSMVPSTKDSLVYENDSMRIKFQLAPKFIAFTLYNKINDAMQIKWDEASMSIKGKTYKVVHKETGVYKTRELQPSSTIPPHSYLDDGLIPTEKIYYTNVGFNNYVVLETIFPNYSFGNKKVENLAYSLKGATVVIYLPIYIGGIYSAKSFQILISDITKSEHRPKS